MGYELERAQMEAARNGAEDEYFKARPQIDCNDRRKVFDAGFERAWAVRQAEIDRLNIELQKRDQCSYMGPMRDCPTHGESKDAARYRWLRKRVLAADFDWQDSGECALVFKWPEDCAVSGDLDATIDAAMLKTPNVKVTGSAPNDLQGGNEA